MVQGWNDGSEPYNQIHDLKKQLEAAKAALREICICAAIKLKDGRIIRGHRHDFCFKYAMQIPSFKDSDFDGHEQGFITSTNRFVDRREGMRLQIAAGVPCADPGGYRGSVLVSEDLY